MPCVISFFNNCVPVAGCEARRQGDWPRRVHVKWHESGAVGDSGEQRWTPVNAARGRPKVAHLTSEDIGRHSSDR